MSIIKASCLNTLIEAYQRDNRCLVIEKVNAVLNTSLDIKAGQWFNIQLDLRPNLVSLTQELLKDAGYEVEEVRAVAAGNNESGIRARIRIPEQKQPSTTVYTPSMSYHRD